MTSEKHSLSLSEREKKLLAPLFHGASSRRMQAIGHYINTHYLDLPVSSFGELEDIAKKVQEEIECKT